MPPLEEEEEEEEEVTGEETLVRPLMGERIHMVRLGSKTTRLRLEPRLRLIPLPVEPLPLRAACLEAHRTEVFLEEEEEEEEEEGLR
jgi:hypothetical protein